jgi:hypothetical protein
VNQLVPCYLKPQVAATLRRLAVLAGSESVAVERLIEFWNANQASDSSHPAMDRSPSNSPAATWRSTTGDDLPVGARLEAPYKGKMYYAVVERQGIKFGKSLFQSPSAAGRAVKASVGVSGAAAQTDGRSFWRIRNPATGRLVPIGELNPRRAIDTDALLRQLSVVKD